MFWINCKIFVKGAKPPEIGRIEDAGYDLYSAEDGEIWPKCSKNFRLGFATEFCPGWVGLVADRSSMGLKGVIKKAGVIDSGFRGEWIISLFNSGDSIIVVESVIENPRARAIAQVIFIEYGKTKVEIVEQLGGSNRGESGFGSTNK